MSAGRASRCTWEAAPRRQATAGDGRRARGHPAPLAAGTGRLSIASCASSCPGSTPLAAAHPGYRPSLSPRLRRCPRSRAPAPSPGSPRPGLHLPVALRAVHGRGWLAGAVAQAGGVSAEAEEQAAAVTGSGPRPFMLRSHVGGAQQRPRALRHPPPAPGRQGVGGGGHVTRETKAAPAPLPNLCPPQSRRHWITHPSSQFRQIDLSLSSHPPAKK